MCEPLPGKKLSQTTISSYFSGSKISFTQVINTKKKRNGRKRKVMSVGSSQSSDSSEMALSKDLSCAQKTGCLSCGRMPKRKLKAPIFSDAEDDSEEENHNIPLKESRIQRLSKKPTIPVTLNKPKTLVTSTPLNSPSKSSGCISMISFSTVNSHIVTETQSTGSEVQSPNENSVQRSTIPINLSSRHTKDVQTSPSISKDSITVRENELNTTIVSFSRRRLFDDETVSSLGVVTEPTTSKDSIVVVKENVGTIVGLNTSKGSIIVAEKRINRRIASSTSKQRVDNTTSPNKIHILENYVISPSVKGLPKEEVKDQKKKVNYETLKVMREFYINVLKCSHLKSLLNKKDHDMLFNFFKMERDYQYTCIKLFLWKPIWYNIFKYIEGIGLKMSDSDVSAMYHSLKENNFIDTDYMVEDTFTLLNLLKLKELREISAGFKLPTAHGKEDLVSKLLKNCKTQITLTCIKNAGEVLRDRIKEKLGYCFKLSSDLNRCLRYIFLLNTFTNPSLILPQDYFKNVTYFNSVFPTYKIETFYIFITPQDFSKYADAVQLQQGLEESIEKNHIEVIYQHCMVAFERLQQLNSEVMSADRDREPYLERFTPNAQYISLITKGLQHLKRTSFNDVKVWLEFLISQEYCKHKRGDWYCTLSLIYTEYLKDYKAAAKVIIKALKDEKEYLTDVQLQEVLYRANITNRKSHKLSPLFHDEIVSLSPPSCDRDWPQQVLDCKSMKSEKIGQKRKYVHHCENGDTEYISVEETALRHYYKSGFPKGLHCEGGLIIASFSLLFWDIIYNKYVKGTFVSSLQNVPLDMYTQYFYTNRERSIQKRLVEIRETWNDEQLKARLIDYWDQHSHESSLCQIESVVSNVEVIFEVIMCIGRSIMAKIFERLVKNYRVYHSGFPDLIVWNVQEKKAKFVEVKGENDKLSIKQKLWLNYLMDIGASVEVCRVEPKASKKKLKKNES